jgi:poly(3-hydroxybutyrate) depolymerase
MFKWFALLFVLVISGCRLQSGVVVETDQKLASAPHRFDVYRAPGAQVAVVFLHGGGGTKKQFAQQLQGDDWERLLIDNKALAVFPQGQAIAAAPRATTWSNHVMTSGVDDVAFLRDLVRHIAHRYGVSRFYLAGHSNGGMMAGRVFYELPALFEGYVMISGPPSARYLGLAGPMPRPVLCVVGDADAVLQNGGAVSTAVVMLFPDVGTVARADIVAGLPEYPARVVDKALDHLVRVGRLHRVARGVYALSPALPLTPDF